MLVSFLQSLALGVAHCRTCPRNTFSSVRAPDRCSRPIEVGVCHCFAASRMFIPRSPLLYLLLLQSGVGHAEYKQSYSLMRRANF